MMQSTKGFSALLFTEKLYRFLCFASELVIDIPEYTYVNRLYFFTLFSP